MFRTRVVHTSGNSFDFFLKIIVNISSYIQKNTRNPNPIFKISSYNTNHTNNSKIHFKINPQH